MKKSCFCLILLLVTSVAFPAVKIELKSDKSASAEVAEDKAKQLFSVSLSFLPVSTLDAVTNDEMTEILAQFFAEEALSSYLKSPRTVDFAKAKCIVHKKNEKRCVLTYDIPITAISDVKSEQQSISDEAIRKYFASASSDTLLQDFRSACFHDLRIAEAVFMEQIKNCKDKKRLTQKIDDAFSALIKKINADDALFLSEKEELQTKANSIKRFLLNNLSVAAPSAKSQPDDLQNTSGNITHATFLPEFKPFLLSDPILLDIGGCKAFRTEDGKTVLIAVGTAEVKNQSAKDRILRQKIAEQRAFGELAKHQHVKIVDFSQQEKQITIKHINKKESSSSIKKNYRKTTVAADAYVSRMKTIGTWYSADQQIFYLAKGIIYNGVENE